jgi:L-asparaginase
LQGFASPNFPPLGKAGVTVDLNESLILDPPEEEFNFVPINPKNRVVVVKLFPGIDAEYLSGVLKGGQPEGIVLETFGIGDAPTKKDFLERIKMMTNDGIVIVNVSQCIMHSVNEKDYATGTALKKVGVITGLDMTTEAALGKLHFLISNVQKPTHAKMESLMKLNMRGELVDKQSIYLDSGMFL